MAWETDSRTGGYREMDRHGVIFEDRGHKIVSDSEWVIRKREESRTLLGLGPEQLGRW